eukprot:7388568-Prymnesium_polylepis.1
MLIDRPRLTRRPGTFQAPTFNMHAPGKYPRTRTRGHEPAGEGVSTVTPRTATLSLWGPERAR